MHYPLAERFKAPQGEGLHTGTPMAFLRFVGCSVGQAVCTACDTNFARMYPELGGGLYTAEQLMTWVGNYEHVCLTGGEPLDRNLEPLVEAFENADIEVHIETSGTVRADWLDERPWVCVSPKPGYLPEMIQRADEIKVILGGLGESAGWPSLAQAVKWSKEKKLVYLQPRNHISDVDQKAMDEVIDLVTTHPTLRLSAQLHKYLRVR